MKHTEGNIPLPLLKRFSDDILTIFIGSTKNLHKFINEINNIHPSINFTMSHTSVEGEEEEQRCSCQEQKSIQFLDTSLSIKDGKNIS